MLSLAKDIYERAPSGLRSLFEAFPQPFLLTRPYWSTKNHLKRFAKMSYEAQILEQRNLLKSTLVNAVTSVPYYKETVSSNFSKADIASDPFAVLREFPILSRDTVANNLDYFISDKVPERSRYLATTGGSTGTPLKIWLHNDVWAKEWAFVYDYLNQFGVGVADKRVSLRGVRRMNISDAAFELNPLYKELRVSPFHLASAHIGAIQARVKKSGFSYLHGYPSAIRDLISLLGPERCRELFSDCKVILAVSENVYEPDVKYIESATGSRLASFYGHSERACFAPYYKDKALWVPNALYGVSEAQKSKLIVTGFINNAMPLIRYDTDDEVNVPSDGVFKVGYGFGRVNGRWNQDYMVGKSGQKITMTALNSHIEEFKFVRKFQFVQTIRGFCVVKIVWTDDPGGNILNKIVDEFRNKCGNELNITSQIVKDIPLSNNGKHAFIIKLF